MLSPPGSNNAVRVFEGLWHQTSKDVNTGAPFTDVTAPKEEVTVGSVDDMDDFESRKLWRHVAKGIREGDFEFASREKTKIEVSLIIVLTKQWSDLMKGVFLERPKTEETR